MLYSLYKKTKSKKHSRERSRVRDTLLVQHLIDIIIDKSPLSTYGRKHRHEKVRYIYMYPLVDFIIEKEKKERN